MGRLLLVALSLGAPQGDAGPASADRDALRAEAETILAERQGLVITSTQARRRVELLLRALRSWADESAVELIKRARTYRAPAMGEGEILSTDRCPLFFKEDIEERDEVCPLDLTRSELWGASAVFCRYVCAPKLD